MKFLVNFKDCPPIECEIFDTPLGKRYYNQLFKEYKKDPYPIFRDQQKYTTNYLKDLAVKGKEILGWDWIHDIYDISTTTKLHKNIEAYLAKGFEKIPESHDYLLNELHFCLHSIESGSKRGSWIQIEWFNDSGFYISEDEFPAKINLEFGDIRLQNPYVGHYPLLIYQQQDKLNIMQTCKFHDFVKPGFNLVIKKDDFMSNFDETKYLQWFETYGSDFINLHGKQKLLKYTGHPIIGKVKNTKDLEKLVNQEIIKFISLDFPR